MDDIAALRIALSHSPDSVPLRKMIAEKLLAQEAYEDAENEYRTALKFDPDSSSLLSGMAECYLAQGKVSAASVVVEKLLNQSPSDEIRLLQARILARRGKPLEALDFYHEAVEGSPELEDEAFAEELYRITGRRPSVEEEIPYEDEGIRIPIGGEQESLDFLDAMERPACNFDSVGGMDEVKEAIRMKIIYPLKNKELFEAYGKKLGGGVLLYGPPGCGKTLLARATAGQIRAPFLPVGLHDILDMWLGNSEKQLHALFEQARRSAPCVLFFDEADALAASRNDMRQSAGRHTINQFLSELDGVVSENEGILILAATNAPWHIDDAFRRPGRFDRIIFVPPPDEKARMAIWQLHLNGKPTDSIDYGKLAAKSVHFSGADIRAAVDLAVESTLEQAMKRGQPLPLTTKTLLRTTSAIRPSTKEWFATAKNYATYANESGLYDDILNYMGKGLR